MTARRNTVDRMVLDGGCGFVCRMTYLVGALTC